MARKVKDLTCVNGRFQRDLGKLPSGRQPRFYLGTDEAEARVRCARLEQFWESAGGKVWTEWMLKVAHAIRQGQEVFPVPKNEGVRDNWYYDSVQRLRQMYSGIRFVPQDAESYDRGRILNNVSNEHLKLSCDQDVRLGLEDPREVRAKYLLDYLPPPDMKAASLKYSGHTLHGTLNAFADWIKANYKDKSSNANEPEKTSDYGLKLADVVGRLKRSHPDVPLEEFDDDAIRAMVKFWTDRPVARTHANKGKNKRIRPKTVIHQVKAIRSFVKWLGNNGKTYKWTRPLGMSELWRISESDLLAEDEIAELRRGVPTYRLDELITLYRYATDYERVHMLAGLNLAFAQSECRTFRTNEMELEGARRLVKRIRRKTKVYGEFLLWPEAFKAFQWLAKERVSVSSPENPFVFLTENGKRPSSQRIYKTWDNLLDRVCKDYPEFRRLSYKYLRKTAAQLMLDHGGDENDGDEGADEITVGIFLCHGQPVKSDFHADEYYRRKFRRVFKALEKVHQYLAPMFAVAPDAFTTTRKKGGANISQAVINRIRELDAQGVSRSEIVRTVGVARATVYRWLVPPQEKSADEFASAAV